MRYIPKRTDRPLSLEAFLVDQLPVGLNLDYQSGFSDKPALRAELIAEQFGLCAYTGTAIDARLGSHRAANPDLKLQPHIEHLKAQSVCRQEIVDRGGKVSFDLGEDMDHRNMVAALEVKGSRAEQFGASARTNAPLLVLPTQPDCESRFAFSESGRVRGLDPDAVDTIARLKLNHTTLEGWRKVAMETFLDPIVVTSRQDLEIIVAAMDVPANGQLAEFSFCIKSVANQLL